VDQNRPPPLTLPPFDLALTSSHIIPLSFLFPKSTSALLVLVVFRVVAFSADWIAQYFECDGDSAEFFVRVGG
jgi:hypothetical protein